MDLVLEDSKAAGYERRNISPEEIEERCMYALINEGFKCLEEGVVDKPGDIDIIWIYGCVMHGILRFPRMNDIKLVCVLCWYK